MQDQPLVHSGTVASTVIEDLDLVASELRRRVADMGLAVAELRHETGRLRASCGQGDAPGVAAVVTARADVVAPVVLAAGVTAGVDAAPIAAAPSEPASPWGWDPAAVPAAAPVAAAAVPVMSSGVAPTPMTATPMTATPMTATQTMAPPQPPAPTMWGDADDADAAAFEAFFSAEIEPEPAQRWLLSD